MKFVKLLLNMLQFCVLLVGAFLICGLISLSLSLQTKEKSTGFTFWSIDEKAVGLNDAVGFWGDSVQANFATYNKTNYSNYTFLVGDTTDEYVENDTITIIDKSLDQQVQIDRINVDYIVSGPKFRARNWLRWRWYKDSIGIGIDYAFDAVASVVSPIALPTMNVKNLEKFYGKQLYDFREDIEADSEKLGEYVYAIQALYNCEDEYDFQKWVDEHKVMYDYMYKIAKYNAYTIDSEGNRVYIYEKYYNKFVGEDGVMNSNVVLLYYTVFITILVALWIVYQYPITIKENSEGHMEADGGLIKKTRKHSVFWKKKKKKAKKNE